MAGKPGLQEDSFARGLRLLARLIVRAYVQRIALPSGELEVADTAVDIAADQEPVSSCATFGTDSGEPPIEEGSADGVIQPEMHSSSS